MRWPAKFEPSNHLQPLRAPDRRKQKSGVSRGIGIGEIGEWKMVRSWTAALAVRSPASGYSRGGESEFFLVEAYTRRGRMR